MMLPSERPGADARLRAFACIRTPLAPRRPGRTFLLCPKHNSQPSTTQPPMNKMKSAIIIGVISATIVMIGCSKEPSGSSTTLPPGSKTVAVSDGSNTFYLGATTIKGTNVSATNVTSGVRIREGSK